MRLIELRKKNKLTQNDVANFLNIGRTTYSAYEQKANMPDIETLKKLSHFYNVSLDYLCENNTSNLIDTSGLNDNKKEIINLVEKLNEKNEIILLGYITRMLQEQGI